MQDYTVNPINNTAEAMEYAFIGAPTPITGGGGIPIKEDPGTLIGTAAADPTAATSGPTGITGGGGITPITGGLTPTTGGGTPTTGGGATSTAGSSTSSSTSSSIAATAEAAKEEVKKAATAATDFVDSNKKYLIWLLLLVAGYLVYRFGIKKQ